MRRNWPIFMVLAALLLWLPQPAPAQLAAPGLRFAGEWSGRYVCAQGVTGMRIIVSPTGDNNATAVVHFFAIGDNPDVPEGCFTMTGSYDPVSGQFNLRRGQWIIRPRNYNMVDLSGTVDVPGQTFTGRLVGVSGCSNFVLSRAVSMTPIPPACAAQAR